MRKRALTIVAGFVHDFSAALWVSTVLTVWWLDSRLPDDPSAARILQGLQRNFFWTGVCSTAVVFLTGAGRGFTYVEGAFGPEAENLRRKMLWVKHVILIGVFAMGTWWQYRMAFS